MATQTRYAVRLPSGEWLGGSVGSRARREDGKYVSYPGYRVVGRLNARLWLRKGDATKATAGYADSLVVAVEVTFPDE